MVIRPKKNKQKDTNLKRINKQTICFNNREIAAISYFCNKYKVQNKSKFMREAIISEVLKKFDDDYPTLFEDQEQLTLSF
ncbi:MAG: hypothetical protein JXB17_06725 [Bacteroidales bacterium]|nr:hypothetical protein [Bacteroidales bacterium]